MIDMTIKERELLKKRSELSRMQQRIRDNQETLSVYAKRIKAGENLLKDECKARKRIVGELSCLVMQAGRIRDDICLMEVEAMLWRQENQSEAECTMILRALVRRVSECFQDGTIPDDARYRFNGILDVAKTALGKKTLHSEIKSSRSVVSGGNDKELNRAINQIIKQKEKTNEAA